jgi:hypothetical protein
MGYKKVLIENCCLIIIFDCTIMAKTMARKNIQATYYKTEAGQTFIN